MKKKNKSKRSKKNMNIKVESISEEKTGEELSNIEENVVNEETIILDEKEKKSTNTPHKTKLLITIAIIAIAIIILGYIFLFPTITLKGDKSISLNYKQQYKEAGYSASFLGKDLTKKVKVKGKVNSLKLGKYKITYEVKGLLKRKVVRQVKVIDKSAPVITLNSKDDIYLCPGEKYKTDSYKAYDNYDGDITGKVKVKYLKNKVIYTVSDSSNNKKEVSRKLIYKDIIPPEVTLNGNEIEYLFLGDTYNDNKAVAIDNCDGDITKDIIVSGNIDTSKTGENELTYTISDQAGNKTSKSRKIIVSEKKPDGTIYLTFDDGPKSGTTDIILDILKEQNVKATFFVTNNGPDELIKRAYEEGHSIGLHTATHNYSIVYSSVDAYFNDLNTVGERVKRITGLDSKIIRFPGGSSNTVSRHYSIGIMSTLTSEVVKRGYRYYDWNLSSGDAAGGRLTADDIYNNVVSNLRKDRINMVLLHDIKPYTRDALRNIIIYGKNNGYSFEKIDDGTEMVTQRVNN